jgi:hypothetical protein
MAAGGYDIGASFSGSSSSGASLSGATDFSAGGNYGGLGYGAGAVVFGPTPTTPAQRSLVWLGLIAGAVLLALLLIPLLFKGGR